MDCKVGDIVHVRGRVLTVHRDGDANVHLDTCHENSWSRIDRSAIVHVEPHPIAVGDTVRAVGCSEDQYGGGPGAHMGRMKVVAIVDGRAWCRSSGYDYIIEVEKLERVP